MQHHTSLRSCNTIRWLYNINLLHIRIVLLMPLPIISKMLNGYYTYHIPPWRATQQLWGKKISKVEEKFKQIHYYSLWVLEVGTHNTADLCSRDGTTGAKKELKPFCTSNTPQMWELLTMSTTSLIWTQRRFFSEDFFSWKDKRWWTTAKVNEETVWTDWTSSWEETNIKTWESCVCCSFLYNKRCFILMISTFLCIKMLLFAPIQAFGIIGNVY